MATAGRSIVYSGVTVMLGMLVLTVLVDLMVIRSISLGVMLVAATALIAGVTLLPAVLGLLSRSAGAAAGDPEGQAQARGARASGTASATRSCAGRGLWLAASLALILVIAWPAREMKLLGATPKLLPGAAESVKGVDILNEEFGENLLVADPDRPERRRTRVSSPRSSSSRLDRLTNSLAADPRAASVTSLATYMVAEPRDGRWSRITAKHDFAPAPDIANLEEDEVTPGVFLENTIDVWADEVPHSPAYFGFARFNFPSGADHQLQVTPTFQVYRVNTGSLTVQAARSGQALAQRRLRRARQGPGRRRRHGRHARTGRSADRPAADGCQSRRPTRRPR